MIGNFTAEAVRQVLSLPENLHPLLIVAFGKPDENIVLVDVQNGETNYYRDAEDTHYVPKRSLADELIN